MTAPLPFGFDRRPDGVAVLTLSDPATLNALTFESYRALGELARSLATDEEVRALVITGAGRAFCSGGHVHQIIGRLVDQGLDQLRAFTELTAEAVRALRALRKPVVAAINGVAVGGGAALALAADVRIAAPEARMGFVFPRVGLSAADMGTSWLLPRMVGLGRATHLLLTGEMLDAETAVQWGLVSWLAPADQLVDQAVQLAMTLASGPLAAHAATKEALDRSSAVGFDEALRIEAEIQAACMQTDDFREAYRALVERRAPRFSGK